MLITAFKCAALFGLVASYIAMGLMVKANDSRVVMFNTIGVTVTQGAAIGASLGFVKHIFL